MTALRFALIVACGLPAAAWADGPGSPPAAPPAKSDASPNPESAAASDIAAALAAAVPKYKPPPAAAGKAAPATGVIRMPTFLVREPKLPTPEEVLSRKGVESLAMDRYLGSPDGLDRGVLNHVTLGQLWTKIPVLGHVAFVPFGSISDEDRAMELYEQDQRLEEKADLTELVSLMKKSGDPAGGDQLKRVIDDTFSK